MKLSKLIPVLARTAAAAEGADPFSVLAAATGGTQLHFRTQSQLEDAIALIGVQLRSLYTLSFRPGEGGEGARGITPSAWKPRFQGRRSTRARATD